MKNREPSQKVMCKYCAFFNRTEYFCRKTNIYVTKGKKRVCDSFHEYHPIRSKPIKRVPILQWLFDKRVNDKETVLVTGFWQDKLRQEENKRQEWLKRRGL